MEKKEKYIKKAEEIYLSSQKKLLESWNGANNGEQCKFCGAIKDIKIYHFNDDYKEVCKVCLPIYLHSSYHGCGD